ncbi:MAG: hypothetical protein IKJ99_03480 [Oscillospiraceae bacterium]|nr:hypothetical protein [Oscillospiraceae bacterium]
MNIRLFNKNYWIRRFGEQSIIKGYVRSSHSDFGASLNLHPLGTDEMAALPEGQRMVKRLEGHGEIELNVADQKKNQKGDLVYYHGYWYECESCQLWDHTILSHYNYQFVMVPTDAAGTTDLDPPVGLPTVREGGRGT